MIYSICKEIETNSSKIIEKISNKDIEDYLKIKELYEADKIPSKDFQYIFDQFYRLNPYMKAKDKFYQIFDKNKYSDSFNFIEVLEELFEHTNRLEFSFVTKMCHTINDFSPIYDRNVAKVFGFGANNDSKKEIMIKRYLLFYEELNLYYLQIQNENLFNNVLKEFDDNHQANISVVKKIDFIIWAYGSVKK